MKKIIYALLNGIVLANVASAMEGQADKIEDIETLNPTPQNALGSPPPIPLFEHPKDKGELKAEWKGRTLKTASIEMDALLARRAKPKDDALPPKVDPSTLKLRNLHRSPGVPALHPALNKSDGSE